MVDANNKKIAKRIENKTDKERTFWVFDWNRVDFYKPRIPNGCLSHLFEMRPVVRHYHLVRYVHGASLAYSLVQIFQ